MKPFNLSRLAGSHPAGLIFTCVNCNRTASQKQAVLGCACGSRLFKTSRYMNLITNPLTPYHKDPAEDGYKLTTPNDISTSMGGQPISVIPHNDSDGTHGTTPPDGTAGEEFGIPNASSDSMLDDHMKDVNIKQHEHKGVHNMNGSSISGMLPSVFEKTRKRLWPHTERKK